MWFELVLIYDVWQVHSYMCLYVFDASICVVRLLSHVCMFVMCASAFGCLLIGSLCAEDLLRPPASMVSHTCSRADTSTSVTPSESESIL